VLPEWFDDHFRERVPQGTRCTMDITTQTHLTSLRGLLIYRLNELRAEVRGARALREPASAGMHEVSDRKDEAAEMQISEISAAEERRDIEELTQVEAALHRLDTGTYGDCTDCGESIALQRLLAQPAALRCAACQSAREHALSRTRAGSVS
jgi:DnaK suppressor protein